MFSCKRLKVKKGFLLYSTNSLVSAASVISERFCTDTPIYLNRLKCSIYIFDRSISFENPFSFLSQITLKLADSYSDMF